MCAVVSFQKLIFLLRSVLPVIFVFELSSVLAAGLGSILQNQYF